VSHIPSFTTVNPEVIHVTLPTHISRPWPWPSASYPLTFYC